MPILPAEPEMYPSTLWQEDRPRDDRHGRWWCLHTKLRQEKMLARALRQRGISHYLPQIVYESRTPGGRTIRSMLPLFPGYLFLHGDDSQRAAALQGDHLANLLAVANQAALEQDLRQIHQLLSAGLLIAPEPTPIAGATIRILAGPLRGLIGTVIRRGGRDRFVAAVRLLGRGVTVDLQDWPVETVPDRPVAVGGRPLRPRTEPMFGVEPPALAARMLENALFSRLFARSDLRWAEKCSDNLYLVFPLISQRFSLIPPDSS